MPLVLVILGLLSGASWLSKSAELSARPVLFFLVALFFEALAIRLPGWGAYSASYVLVLTLAGWDGGVRWAIAAVLALWIWRGLRWDFKLAAAESAALAGAVFCAALLQPFGAGPVLVSSSACYLASEGFLTARTGGRKLAGQRRAWMGLQRLVREIRATGVVAAVGLALARPDWQVVGLLLFPLLAGYRAVAYGIFRLHSQAASQALQEVDQLQATLDLAQRGELAARIQLTATHQQRSLLEAMTRSLASETQLDQAARYLFELLLGSGSYTSLALVSRDREGWTAVACQSPLAKRLENARLLNLREPLWDFAAQSRMAQVVRQDAPDRIFAGEMAGLAIPMGQFLLYLGRNAPALNEKESEWAMWVAETSTPLLEATERRQRQSQVLAQSQAHSQLLQGQVTALSGLLEASRLLTSSLERSSLLGLVEQACKVVFPETSGSLWLKPETAERNWGTERIDCSAERIGRVVQTSRLWVEGRQMIQPLVSFPGALVLQWPSGQALEQDRQCHEQLALLAYSVGLALCNADYLRQVVEAQAELVQKSKMAAVGQLAAGVAHELNSPLGAIALSLTTLASSLTEPRAQRTLDRASRSAQRCQTIIQKLFIYTRLGTARQEKLSLETMVDDALAFFRGQELPANTELEMLVRQPADVFGMSHDLHEMLKNLILNAVESYKPDSPKIKIQVACGCDGNWAMLAVRDWGIGMEANTLERACEPFFTTKTIGTNVGLGLSVSREIARQHGGELSLQSSPGEGCLVTVRLPLQVQSA